MLVLRDISELKELGEGPLALTIGFFDGVHRGHRYLLQRLRAQAALLGARSLVVTFSNSPRGYHHPERHWRYLSLPEEKLALLSESGVDATLMLHYGADVARQSASEFLKGLAGPAPLAGITMGYDSSIGCDMLRGREAFSALAQRLGLALDFVEPFPPQTEPVKSSAIRELIAAGDVALALQLLGHPYFLTGQVDSGKGKGGQKLGTPTANLYVPQEKLTPPTGVYAGAADSLAGRFAAAICVITRQQALRTVLERDDALLPPHEDPTAVVVEAHLIGFHGDLYSTTVTVQFLARLRDFRDFATPAELIAQIERDIAAARAIYAETAASH